MRGSSMRVIFTQGDESTKRRRRLLRSSRPNSADFGAHESISCSQQKLGMVFKRIGVAAGTKQRIDDQVRGKTNPRYVIHGNDKTTGASQGPKVILCCLRGIHDYGRGFEPANLLHTLLQILR